MAAQVVHTIYHRRRQMVRYPISLDEYERMIKAGVFDPNARIELIEGELIAIAPIGDRHAGCVARLTRLLINLVGDMAIVWVQNPVRTGDRSAPQPDLALLKPRDDFYMTGRPNPQDTLLIIEVSDSTLAYDRGAKLRLYSKQGISEYWIINLQRNVIEVYTSPSGDRYSQTRHVRRGETLSLPGELEGIVAVDDVLGPILKAKE